MPPPVVLSVLQLRRVLQLPERPYEDSYAFDGTAYFDISHREVCTMLGISGTVSGTPYKFRPSIDFQITAGAIDWTLPGANKPDVNTLFVADYTYSRLGGDLASSAVANAQLWATMDLGSKYPYGSSTALGIAYNDLATLAAAMCAAREACQGLVTTEIDLAQKARRGSVVIDDTKKTTDWSEAAKMWDERYKKAKILARGMVRGLKIINQSPDASIWGWIGKDVFDSLGIGEAISAYAGWPGSGIF